MDENTPAAKLVFTIGSWLENLICFIFGWGICLGLNDIYIKTYMSVKPPIEDVEITMSLPAPGTESFGNRIEYKFTNTSDETLRDVAVTVVYASDYGRTVMIDAMQPASTYTGDTQTHAKVETADWSGMCISYRKWLPLVSRTDTYLRRHFDTNSKTIQLKYQASSYGLLYSGNCPIPTRSIN